MKAILSMFKDIKFDMTKMTVKAYKQIMPVILQLYSYEGLIDIEEMIKKAYVVVRREEDGKVANYSEQYNFSNDEIKVE